MSNILSMLLRYTFCIISIIILLILALMFFYFNNQISYQNNKLNAMIDVVSDLVKKTPEPIVIPQPYIPGQTNNSFIPQMNIIDVSDSEDDDDDDDDDDEDEEEDDDDDDGDDDIVGINYIDNIVEQIVKDSENIDIVLDDFNEVGDNKVGDNKVGDNKVGDNKVGDNEVLGELEENKTESQSPSLVDKDTSVTIEVSLDTDLTAQPKHRQISYKSLQVNELRELVFQKNLLPNSEVKKMKKNELIDLLNQKEL